jgi:hypothetical protein
VNPSTWPTFYKNDDPALRLVPAFSQARRLHGSDDRGSFTIKDVPADPGYVACRPLCTMQAGSHFSRQLSFAVHSGAHSLTLTTAGEVPLRSGAIVDLGEGYTSELVGDGSKFVDGTDGTVHVLEPGTYWFETTVVL